MYKLYNGDCLEVMKEIPSESVDLIVTDPPYNIKKAIWDKWKTTEAYINWCGKWILECQRVLKDNGSFYFFHNDMKQIAQLMEWIRLNSKFIFNSFVIWDKGDFRALSWKNPSEKNNLRSWFNTCEYCLYYTFQDETGLTTVKLDTNNFPTLREYFKELQEYLGLSLKKVNETLGHRKAEHCFYWKTSQWDLPTKETYQELKEVFQIDKWIGFREYESLRQEYESLRYIHNLDENHNNVWKSKERNNGKLHPTQKPIDILERIIKASSHENQVVLDPFMGSGSTGVAALNTKRRFIGIEKEERYFNIAMERIKQCTSY